MHRFIYLKGKIIHSVQFKSAKLNDMSGKRVLLVGIGNSSVDAADNLVTQGGYVILKNRL